LKFVAAGDAWLAQAFGQVGRSMAIEWNSAGGQGFAMDGDTSAAPPARNGSAIRLAILSCGVGQVFEIYDFLIYAFMAAPLSRAFFPSHDLMTSLLATFATFAVGFVMRPVGAVVIGSYGDRHGRRSALVLTIGLMAIGTGAIGLIPSYASWGLAAPVMLVLCRMAQGFSAGGEWGGAAAFIVEYAPPTRRGFIGSFQQAATAGGILLATALSYALTTLLDPAAFESWGWRCAFLIGFVLGPIGHFLRQHVKETPAFERVAEQGGEAPAPMRATLRDHRGSLLAAFALSIIGCVLNYIFIVFMPSFAQQRLHIPASTTFLSTAIAGLVYLLLSPVFGALSDRTGRKPIYFAVSVLSFVLAYPLFLLLVSFPTAGGMILTQTIASVLMAMFCGPICAMLAEMFPTRIRYTALSVSYGFAVAIFGGLAPYIGTLLVGVTGNPLAPAFYVMISAIPSLIALLFIQERAGAPLPD
jgi:MHS family proline/betaine transporter-like MFS transporter